MARYLHNSMCGTPATAAPPANLRTKTMNANDRCPFPASWTPHQIAGAVAPRLHELDLGLSCIDPGGAANRVRRATRGGYLPQPPLGSRFRING